MSHRYQNIDNQSVLTLQYFIQKHFDPTNPQIKRAGPSYVAGEKRFSQFFALNKRSSQTVVKSKILAQFVVSMKNGS
jgi:hypothetical protein